MHEGNGSEETLRERKMTDKNHNNSDNDDDKNGNNPTVYYVRKDGKKPVVHAVELCCAELDKLHRSKVVEFVSQYDKGHEHLADLEGEIPPLSAILWYPEGRGKKDYLYINNCMMCGRRFEFREQKES